MSWDDFYYIATTRCPCGKGIIKQKSWKREDDWNREEHGELKPIILCSECKKQYHIENNYIVPNDISLGQFDLASHVTYSQSCSIEYTLEEEAVSHFTKDQLVNAINDMQNHSWSTQITDEITLSVIDYFGWQFGKRLKNIIKGIQPIVDDFDRLHQSYTEKKQQIEYYHEQECIRIKRDVESENQRLKVEQLKYENALKKCIRLQFDKRDFVTQDKYNQEDDIESIMNEIASSK